MKIEQAALILYSLREFVQTEDGLKETLEKVVKIGYKAVQVSGIGADGPKPECVRKACDELGLTICATHENAKLILSEPAQVADRLDIFGTDYTAYPHPGAIDLKDPAVIGPWLAELEKATQALKERGKVLTYHNHDIEFLKHDGKLVYERIFEETSIAAELDTYWAQAGGVNVLEWTEKLASAGKLPLMHFKDFRIVDNRTPNFAPIGAGNINFKAIVEAADEGGCRYYIVEQDSCYGRDPFECVAESYTYMRDQLVS